MGQKYDSRLIGNIGNPALSEKQITKKTVFVIEASSYQLDYSKIFTSKYALILNITPDHLERHKNLKNYVNAKFKLLDSQSIRSIALVKDNDQDYFDDLAFGETDSMWDYFDEVSRSQLNVEGTVYGPYTLDGDAADYGTDLGFNSVVIGGAIQHGVPPHMLSSGASSLHIQLALLPAAPGKRAN